MSGDIASLTTSCQYCVRMLKAAYQQPIVRLSLNRVRRNYLGGKILDEWSAYPSPRDGNRPEDWMASTTPARNPGMAPIPDEGLSAIAWESGQSLLWRDLLLKETDFYLGAHAEKFRRHGALFLAKLLDSAVRLHFQGHPTEAFAQKHLGSPWGKFETYVILSVREGIEPHLFAGFQNTPGPDEWRRIILEQDTQAMGACFEPIPVAPGEIWKVPGGIPHAIGPGLFVLEVMEPSDWVVRCEFELNGMSVPPEGRFMGLDPYLALQIFEHTNYTVNAARETFRVPSRPGISERGLRSETLIDERDTSCFRIERWRVAEHAQIPTSDCFSLWIIVGGLGRILTESSSFRLHRGEKFLSAAALPSLAVEANAENPLEILRVQPGSIL